MRELKHLQGAINDRYSRLACCDAETIDHQLSLTRDWIAARPELRAVLDEAKQAEPTLNFQAWDATLVDAEQFAWPSSTEAGRAWLIWQLMNHIASGHAAGAVRQIQSRSRRLRLPVMPLGVREQSDLVVAAFAQQVFKPLFDYLGDQVGAGGSVVHVLQRYVAQLEWFDRDRMYQRYEDAVDKGKVGEDVYDRDVQRFLFLDGGYITQAKVRSASGEADMVGGLDTDDPIVCEGKIYGQGHGAKHLVDGFHQVIQYAHDYNKTVAYLVVFNLTNKLLQFAADGPAGAWAPYVEYANVRVHVIVVRALPPTATASKAGKATVVRISREDLVTTLDGRGESC